MGVKILFEDATVGSIKLSVARHQPAYENAIHLLPFGTASDDVRGIALPKACIASERALTRRGSLKPKDRYAFYYEVKDREENGKDILKKVIGGSCGLPTALALCLEIIKDEKERIKYDKHKIAATGEISNLDDEECKIGRIDSLIKKLQGAADCLEDGSTVFYPSENGEFEAIKKTLPEDLKKKIRGKKLEVISVKTLAEALDHIFPHEPIMRAFKLKKALIAASLLVALGLFYSIISYPLATYLLENGNCKFAQIHVNVASRLLPWDSRLIYLRDLMNKRFHPGLFFNYLSQSGEENSYIVEKVPNGLPVSASDSYAFRVQSDEPIYLYIFEIGALQALKIRFPNESLLSSDPPAWEQKTYVIPKDGGWFFPQGPKGILQVYIIASLWRCKELEDMLFKQKNKVDLTFQQDDLIELLNNRRTRCGFSTVARIVLSHE